MTQKVLGIGCGVLLAFGMAVIPQAARADQFDQATQLNFSKPIQIPYNQVLPAGTYWFVLGEPSLTSNIVEIYNADRTKLIATMATIPTVRTDRTNDDVVKLARQSTNRPDALLDWFYADRVTGHQFVYSPRREDQLNEDPKVTVVAQNAPQQSFERATKAKYAMRLHNADHVMQAVLNSPGGIPSGLLSQARAIVVIPSAFNAALLVGDTYGRGVMLCRTGTGFTGPFGAPAFYALNGGSLGLQAGGESTNYVFLIMNRKTVHQLLDGQLKLGVDASVAAGPVGDNLVSYAPRGDVLTYSRTRGVFAGVSLDGATLRPDHRADAKVYDERAAAIVREPATDSPKAARPLVALLDHSSPALS